MMKYMMMSEMMKGWNNNANNFGGTGNNNGMFGNMMNNPMGLMMMSSMFGGDDIFEGMFDFDEYNETPELTDDTVDNEEDA